MISPTTLPISEIAGYLQAQLGQRIAAHLADLRDAKQIGRYRKPDGPAPNQRTDLRLREGYKIVRMIVESFDEKTARAWLFGTNTRLDDEAPIDVLRPRAPPGANPARRAEDPAQFAVVRAAARQLVSFEG
ncbi:MAG: XRE family transcriptional regulator [Solirubrobacterales bacterium]|nr:XRE family transcriptional regulator [Solirubrobacterales bacterium]